MMSISMNQRLRYLLLILALLPAVASAHKPSDSYLRVSGDSERLTAEWDIALKDLELAVGLDSNRDGQITWGELKQKQGAVSAHALSHLTIWLDDQACGLQLEQLRFNRHSDGGYAALIITSDCAPGGRPIKIDYSLFFDRDPTHRGLVSYTRGSTVYTQVLTPDAARAVLDPATQTLWRSFVTYVDDGIHHILIGFDHILFLLSLLLPTVLYRRQGRWQAVTALRPTTLSVLKIVTVFTLAHSITLWLAVMQIVTLPAQLVEATIAFSIVVTALNNLYPVLPRHGWLIAFLFGLVHGFGFANVLLDLGLADSALGVSLLGFNIGVELGQIAIVIAFIPLAYLLRQTAFYRVVVLQLGSILIAMIALLWMIERLFDVVIIGSAGWV